MTRIGNVLYGADDVTASGAALVRGPEEGPHETRAVLRDPAGNPFVVYASRT